jgi:hypothetical protein
MTTSALKTALTSFPVTNKAQVVTASLYGNSRDALGGGGLNL